MPDLDKVLTEKDVYDVAALETEADDYGQSSDLDDPEHAAADDSGKLPDDGNPVDQTFDAVNVILDRCNVFDATVKGFELAKWGRSKL